MVTENKVEELDDGGVGGDQVKVNEDQDKKEEEAGVEEKVVVRLKLKSAESSIVQSAGCHTGHQQTQQLFAALYPQLCTPGTSHHLFLIILDLDLFPTHLSIIQYLCLVPSDLILYLTHPYTCCFQIICNSTSTALSLGLTS